MMTSKIVFSELLSSCEESICLSTLTSSCLERTSSILASLTSHITSSSMDVMFPTSIAYSSISSSAYYTVEGASSAVLFSDTISPMPTIGLVTTSLTPLTTFIRPSTNILMTPRRSATHSISSFVAVSLDQSSFIPSKTLEETSVFQTVQSIPSSSVDIETTVDSGTTFTVSSAPFTSIILPSPASLTVSYDSSPSIKASYHESSIPHTSSVKYVEPSPTTLVLSSSSVVYRPSINDTEGVVSIYIFLPLGEDSESQEFKDDIARKLLKAFIFGLAKPSRRKRREAKERFKVQAIRINSTQRETPTSEIENVLKSYLVDLRSRVKINQETKRTVALNFKLMTFLDLLENNYPSRKERSLKTNTGSQTMPSFLYRRFRRATDDYRVQITSIKRTPNEKSENVDVNYRILKNNQIVPASEVADTTNRLTDNELMYTLKTPVTRRPQPLVVEPSPKPSADDDNRLTIAAIVVPASVALLLLVLYLYIKCVARKRKKVRQASQQKMKTEQPAKEMQEPRTSPYYRSPPPKPKDLYQAATSRRRSSSTSDEERYRDRPLPVPPPIEPAVEVLQPKERHLRRDKSKQKNTKTKRKEKNVKRSTENEVEMKPLAGVIENAPRLGENLLPKDEPKEKIPVRFSALPPLVQTPLVGRQPNQPFEEREDKEVEPGKTTSDSILPQANVERMRNKIRQREKLRHDMREKERKKEEKLKQERGIDVEDAKKSVDSQETFPEPSYDAIRKKKMRRDRWIHNRVGTSISLDSSSDTSSQADSEIRRREEEEKLKLELEKLKNKKKLKKAKKDARNVGVSGLGPKAVAHDALRESNWVTSEAPGVQLVNVKPRDLDEEYQLYPNNAVPLFTKQPIKQQVVYEQPQSQYVQDLLNSAYPTLPPFLEPAMPPADLHHLSSPRESVLIDVAEEERDPDENIYQSLGSDPHVPRVASMVLEDETSPRSNLYEEPLFSPASLPQSPIVRPMPIYQRTAFPSDILRQQPQMSSPIAVPRRRPSSTRPNPQGGRGTRPSSAHTSPSPSYIPRQYVQERLSRETPPVEFVSPRSYTRPPSAASTQPSLGTSPKYMSTPRSNREPRDPYHEARSMLDSARRQVDRFEREKLRDDPDGVSNGHPKPRPAIVKPSRVSQPKTPNKETQDRLAAMEKAELEAQMLVSRALARARSNVKS